MPKGMCYGQTDVPLAPNFAIEAQEVKKNIQHFRSDLCFSSPLSRCTRLADYCLPNKNFMTDPRLMEMHFGDWEGQMWDKLKGTYVNQWMKNHIELCCPNGESMLQFAERVKDFVNALGPGKRYLLFTHGGVIRVLYHIFLFNTLAKSF
ncbi:MAG: alpha-ribazole phosphatase [Bacteroidales bacterium]|nr:alpha-ribazole phosphatase [Bacteroidales bacterium]